MGDWERTFGEAGMVDGGDRIIRDIVRTERREARRTDRELRFSTWEEAREWAKKHPGKAVTRNSDGKGYKTRHPAEPESASAPAETPEQQTRRRNWPMARRALDHIETWPSGSRIAYREHRMVVDTLAATIRLCNWEGDQELGSVSFEEFYREPGGLRARIDAWLDDAGAPPAIYVRPCGPLRPPPTDGSMALHLIASWLGGGACYASSTRPPASLYREHEFSIDSEQELIRVRQMPIGILDDHKPRRYFASIPIELFQQCQRDRQSFRAQVDALLDEKQATPSYCADIPDWCFHPVRNAILEIVGEDSPWAITPPATLFCGCRLQVVANSFYIADYKEENHYSYDADQVRKFGLLRRLVKNMQWRLGLNTLGDNELHNEQERPFVS